MTDDPVRKLARRWLPIEDMAFWREFKRRWPVPAENIMNSARTALFSLAEEPTPTLNKKTKGKKKR